MDPTGGRWANWQAAGPSIQAMRVRIPLAQPYQLRYSGFDGPVALLSEPVVSPVRCLGGAYVAPGPTQSSDRSAGHMTRAGRPLRLLHLHGPA